MHPLRFIYSYFLYIAIFVSMMLAFKPVPAELRSDPMFKPLLHSLLAGTDEGHQVLGSDFTLLKSLLPERGQVTLFTDHNPGEVKSETTTFMNAQAFLAPLILSTDTRENIGIIYCSNDEVANRKLREHGYAWEVHVSNGKGIIKKQ